MIKCDGEHLSFYELTIEEKTLFYQQKKQGMLTLPSDEVSTEQYEMMVHALADAGYEPAPANLHPQVLTEGVEPSRL